MNFDCTRKRFRRGHATVEYAVLLIIILAAVGTLAAMQGHAFNSLDTAKMFDADAKTSEPEVEATTNSSLAVVEQLIPYAIPMIAIGGLFVICIVAQAKSSGRAKITIDREESEESPEPPPMDAGERLRGMIYDKRSILMSEMSEEIDHVFEGSFEVYHLMSTNMKVVPPETPADEVRETMTENKMHHMLVCTGRQLLGVISDRDLVKVHAKTASELMTPDPITVTPTNPLIPTVSTMINKRISCLPVAVDGELKGVLTRSDLLVAFQCTMQLMCKMQKEGTLQTH